MDVVDHQSYDLDDYYLSQSRALEDQYLLERGLTREKLREMPQAESKIIMKQALDYASHRIARTETMVHLGQRDVEAPFETKQSHRSIDRLARHFQSQNKG